MGQHDTTPQRGTRRPLARTAGAVRTLAALPPVDVFLYGMVAAGILFRVQAALLYPPSDALWSDPGRHWLYGRNPEQGSPMSAIDPVGYQVWLAAVVKLVGLNRAANGVYAALLSAVTPWVWYRFLREALPSRRSALAGWAILAVLPSWIGIYSYFMTETLFLPLLGLALWLSWRGLRKRDTPSLLRATAAWLAAALTRAVALPMAAVTLGALLRAHDHRGRKVLLMAALSAAFLLPPAARCHRILGVWSPFGYPMLNRIYMESARHTIEMDLYRKAGAFHYVYGFACPAMGEAPLGPFSRWKTSRAGKVRFTVDMDYGARDWGRALREHRAPLPVRLRMTAENWVYLLFGRSWPDCNPARFWDRQAIRSRWMWAPLLIFFLGATARHLRRRRSLPLLPALTLTAWLVVALLPVVPIEGRYRKPLEGLLIAGVLWAVSAAGIPRPGAAREDAAATPEKIPTSG